MYAWLCLNMPFDEMAGVINLAHFWLFPVICIIAVFSRPPYRRMVALWLFFPLCVTLMDLVSYRYLLEAKDGVRAFFNVFAAMPMIGIWYAPRILLRSKPIKMDWDEKVTYPELPELRTFWLTCLIIPTSMIWADMGFIPVSVAETGGVLAILILPLTSVIALGRLKPRVVACWIKPEYRSEKKTRPKWIIFTMLIVILLSAGCEMHRGHWFAWMVLTIFLVVNLLHTWIVMRAASVQCEGIPPELPEITKRKLAYKYIVIVTIAFAIVLILPLLFMPW